MEKPGILTEFHDEAHNMNYQVWAFRKLTDLEMVQAVRLYLSQPKILQRRTPERNKTVTTSSLIGSEIDHALGWPN